MKTYITKEQAATLAERYALPDGLGKPNWHVIFNAAIQAYRDSLVADVVLPPMPDWQYANENGALYGRVSMEHYARQAIADALCVAEKETAELRLYKHNMETRFKGLNSMLKDALAKQVTRAPMFEFRECEDSQAAAPDPKEAM